MVAKTVFVVGGQPSRTRFEGILASSAFKPIGGATTLAEAHDSLCDAEAERADIVLVDIHHGLDGDEAELLRAIREKQPAAKIIVLGDRASIVLLEQACPTGIDGYLLHAVPPDVLVHALDLVVAGQRILPPRSRAARPASRSALRLPSAASGPICVSDREAQVLQLLAGGLSNKAIAHELAISNETVKVFIRNLLRKLNARNRTQAALLAIKRGVVRSNAVARLPCVRRGSSPDRHGGEWRKS